MIASLREDAISISRGGVIEWRAWDEVPVTEETSRHTLCRKVIGAEAILGARSYVVRVIMRISRV